jgi:hypothetical protein
MTAPSLFTNWQQSRRRQLFGNDPRTYAEADLSVKYDDGFGRPNGHIR